MTTDFPAGFLWGCATSAYQIEGSPLADGAAPSNWHRFAHTPGRITGGDTGDIAAEHAPRQVLGHRTTLGAGEPAALRPHAAGGERREDGFR